MTIVAVIAPGAMGAAVGRRLASSGVEVLTSLAGRSGDSVARAADAGMRAVSDADLAGAEVILSIVPPGQALALAQRLAPVLAGASRKPVYADCNAVSPQTVRVVEAALSATGATFCDAGIVGGPPKPGQPGPVFYACGPGAPALAALSQHGLRVTCLTGPVGAASGLKMSYAGLTKGMTALSAAMILAATRFGAAEDLRQELVASQGQLLARMTGTMPDMYPKAYRWVAEMEEIAAFAGEDAAAQQIYQGIARLYERLAADQAGSKTEIAALDAFLAEPMRD